MHLFLLAGLPASGKSSFAAFLREKLAIAVIAKDEIKEVLFDRIGFSSYEEKRALDICATDMMLRFAESLLLGGQSVILDNNFEKTAVPVINALAQKTGAAVITIRFEGDMDEIYKRFIARDMSPMRHRGHVVTKCYPETEREEYVPMGADMFKKKYTERGMTDFCVGELVTVKCTGEDADSYDSVFERIKKVM